MRSTMLALISVAAMAACGSSTTQTDGAVVHDMTAPQTLPDLVHKPKAKPNCFSVFSNPQADFSAASTTSQGLYTAVVTCLQTTCGIVGVNDGGNASKACATEVDGGESGDCLTCASNAQVGASITFTDSMGNPITCSPSGASDCGACVAQLDACFADPCASDTDCAGITIGGANAVCDVGATNTCVAAP